MNFQKSDAVIGTLILAAAAVFVLTLAAVNRARFAVETYPLYIRLPHIAGIDQGVDVVYQGYKAGAVDHIRIAYEPKLHFIVRMAIKKEIRLFLGTTVIIRSTGFGMGRFLELSPPEGGGRVILEGETLPTVRDTDLMSKANEFIGDVQKMVKDLQKEGTGTDLAHAAKQANLLLANLNALTEENRDAFKATLHQTQGLTGKANDILGRRGAAIDQTLDNLSQASARLPAILQNLEALLAELNRHPWRLVRKGGPPLTPSKPEQKDAPVPAPSPGPGP